jgi:hypothetical protein
MRVDLLGGPEGEDGTGRCGVDLLQLRRIWGRRGTGEGRGGEEQRRRLIWRLGFGEKGWVGLRNFRLSVDVRNFTKNFAMIGRTCNGPNVFYGPNSLRPNESHLYFSVR